METGSPSQTPGRSRQEEPLSELRDPKRSVSQTPKQDGSRTASRALHSKRELPTLVLDQSMETSPDNKAQRPFTSLGFIDGPSKFEDILPSSEHLPKLHVAFERELRSNADTPTGSGRRGGRSAALLWQQKRFLGIGTCPAQCQTVSSPSVTMCILASRLRRIAPQESCYRTSNQRAGGGTGCAGDGASAPVFDPTTCTAYPSFRGDNGPNLRCSGREATFQTCKE